MTGNCRFYDGVFSVKFSLLQNLFSAFEPNIKNNPPNKLKESITTV